jgi:hypothetical protein
LQTYLRDEAIIAIPEVFFPFGTHPGEAAIDPDAESKLLSPSMVLQANPGEINVTNAIIQVKIDEKIPIADWNVSRHDVLTRLSPAEVLAFGLR